MSTLTTRNPIAIRQLLNGTLFTANAATTAGQAEQSLKYRGANKKRILFFLDNPSHEYFSHEAEDAFLKTLTALKLSLDDVALVNYGKCGQESMDEIKKFFNPKVCILLGQEVWNHEYLLHEVFQQGDITVLNTYTFEEMLTNDEKKRAFWKALKRIGALS